MPCSPSPRERIEQTELIDRIKASRHGQPVSSKEIAEAAGVDDSVVSKWQTEGSDLRRMSLAERYLLADHFGWDVVFGVRAARAGWACVRMDAAQARSVEAIVSDIMAVSVAAVSPSSPGGAMVVQLERPSLQALARELLDATAGGGR